jgi:hypothetical protein
MRRTAETSLPGTIQLPTMAFTTWCETPAGCKHSSHTATPTRALHAGQRRVEFDTAPVAQLAEATDSKPVQCEFDSHRGHAARPAEQVPDQAGCEWGSAPRCPVVYGGNRSTTAVRGLFAVYFSPDPCPRTGGYPAAGSMIRGAGDDSSGRRRPGRGGGEVRPTGVARRWRPDAPRGRPPPARKRADDPPSVPERGAVSLPAAPAWPDRGAAGVAGLDRAAGVATGIRAPSRGEETPRRGTSRWVRLLAPGHWDLWRRAVVLSGRRGCWRPGTSGPRWISV